MHLGDRLIAIGFHVLYVTPFSLCTSQDIVASRPSSSSEALPFLRSPPAITSDAVPAAADATVAPAAVPLMRFHRDRFLSLFVPAMHCCQLPSTGQQLMAVPMATDGNRQHCSAMSSNGQQWTDMTCHGMPFQCMPCYGMA